MRPPKQILLYSADAAWMDDLAYVLHVRKAAMALKAYTPASAMAQMDPDSVSAVLVQRGYGSGRVLAHANTLRIPAIEARQPGGMMPMAFTGQLVDESDKAALLQAVRVALPRRRGPKPMALRRAA